MKKALLFIIVMAGWTYPQDITPPNLKKQIRKTVQDSLLGANWVTPQMYGVVSDGVTSNSTLFNNMIVDITNGAGDAPGSDRAMIYFPSGNYNIDTVVTFPSNVDLIFQNGAVFLDSVVIQGTITAGNYKIFDGRVNLVNANIEGIKVEWFGDNTTPGVTDMSDAFKKAKVSGLTSTYPNGCKPILLSATDYLITENNVFGADQVTDSLPKRGWGIKGVGYSSAIKFKPSTIDTAYLYDGGYNYSVSEKNSLISVTLENFRIDIDPTHSADIVNLFRLTGKSGRVTSNWTFRNLYINGDDYGGTTDKSGFVIQAASNANNSEGIIEGCYVRWFRTLLDLRNNEAVNWNISNTNFENGRGDVIRVAGGGSIKWDGGSIINDGAVTDTIPYNFNIIRWINGANNITLNNIRPELRGSDSSYEARVLTASLYENDSTIGVNAATSEKGIITFNNCDLSHVYTQRVIVKAEAQTRQTITFNNCFFEPDNNYGLLEIVDQLDSNDVHYGAGVGTKVIFQNGWAIPDTNLYFGGDSADVYTRVNIRAINCHNITDYLVGYKEDRYIPLTLNYNTNHPLKIKSNTYGIIFDNDSLWGTWRLQSGYTGFFKGSLIMNYSSYTTANALTQVYAWLDTTNNGTFYARNITVGGYDTNMVFGYGTLTTGTWSIADGRVSTPNHPNRSLDSTYKRFDELDTLAIALGITNATGTDYSIAYFNTDSITITQMYAVLRTDGGGNDTAAVNIYWASDISGSSSTLLASDTSLVNTTTGVLISSFNDATIPPNVWVWLQCNHEGGTVNQINVTLKGRYD